MNTSQNNNFEFWRKRIMSFNQACQKHYSDKVSKVVIFGPISNFARSLQAAPLKYLTTQLIGKAGSMHNFWCFHSKTSIHGMRRINQRNIKSISFLFYRVLRNQLTLPPSTKIEQRQLLTVQGMPQNTRCLKVFRYSYSEVIPIFFNRFKSDFIFVWSP